MAVRQKIVIKLPLRSNRCRSRAMQIAASTDGTVVSVSIQGADKDHLVVIGDGIDSANLTRSLKKKFGTASIVRVQPITLSSPERSLSNQYDYSTNRPLDYQPRYQLTSSSYYDNYPHEYRPLDYQQIQPRYQLPSSSSYSDNYPHEHGQAYNSSTSNCTIM